MQQSNRSLIEPLQVIKNQDWCVPADFISTLEASSEGIILYLHGGGYLFGSRNTHRRIYS
ncbi:hypothetical protein H1P_150003 [Hyella patelloides LEGE 07179]|uniref:Alpha/beta hydrolase fold-3 domain-containing protein n=1 Tax=Hyella patelloides LEGE 07179 TaxID=945734 RepID=A0A563VLY1_9CYAN|nr:hypothetical protein H1P_150003 [Hyella patelloides LEGE 07179]